MRIAVAGINGRMGQALKAYISARSGVELSANSVDNNADTLFADADAVIDFTSPEYSLELAKRAAETKNIHIIGTTGFTDAQHQTLAAHAKSARIVWSYNMSIGVNIVAALVEQAAQKLNDDFDVEVLETHHRLKKDSPSGTALMLADSAAKGRGVKLADKETYYGKGIIGERKKGNIGISVRRGGGVVGEHEVSFIGMSEKIDIKHTSFNREIYAHGAVMAALWAKEQPAGIYTMRDVLGI
jgi:4-hydroxy-tetrahydrodipicolinate reductase